MDKVIIKDDQGVERSFTDIRELLAYLDSFQMSFLPDGYEYRVEAPKPEVKAEEKPRQERSRGGRGRGNDRRDNGPKVVGMGDEPPAFIALSFADRAKG